MKFALAFLGLCLVAILWTGLDYYRFLNEAPESEGREILLDVPQGAGFAKIASDLENAGLIKDARKFSWLARFKGVDDRLQAGRFSLNTSQKPGQILDKLVSGQPLLFRVTIPEGLTWWQTAKALADAGLTREDDFREAITDPEFLRHYGVPFADAEGFLMPDTYLVKKPDSPLPLSDDAPPEEREAWKKQAYALAGRMIDNFWRKSMNLWPGANPDSPPANPVKAKPPDEELKKFVILASIVEKETRLDSERGRVAGVYANRIAKNMLLQADPTVIYGLGPAFSGALRRSQLDDAKNPYNTYQNPGLPPGPIASFGVDSLKAAIKPEKHDLLYFVAKTDGGEHVFSRNINDHNRAVEAYRKQKKNKRKNGE